MTSSITRELPGQDVQQNHRLCAELLSTIRDSGREEGAVDVPHYKRELTKRICHIGVGGFHRAHQAFYLHQLLQQGLADGWGICGIALRASDRPLFEILARQDHLYSLWAVDPRKTKVSVIGSLMETVDASNDSAAALAILSDIDTRIVSLTITEAGYCLKASGELNEAHPDIVFDLANFDHPRSALGVIVKALVQRRSAGMKGFTLMSCDNLIENGHRLRSAIIGFAERIDVSLVRWISDHVSFPCSMVDRITPATNKERNQALCTQWGFDDEALVLCEPWTQWILEDHFVAGRPAFERIGVVLTDQVKLFEDMKVGLLNGSHSALAHLGLLSGEIRVHEALAQPLIRRWVRGYMHEIAGTLQPVPGINLKQYQDSLLERFTNPAIDDQLQRLAQDTSSKFQQALLPPLLHCLKKGLPFEHIAAALALWLLYLNSLDSNASARETYQDPRKQELLVLASSLDDGAAVAHFLDATIPVPAQHKTTLSARVEYHLKGLRDKGYEAHLRHSGLQNHADPIESMN